MGESHKRKQKLSLVSYAATALLPAGLSCGIKSLWPVTTFIIPSQGTNAAICISSCQPKGGKVSPLTWKAKQRREGHWTPQAHTPRHGQGPQTDTPAAAQRWVPRSEDKPGKHQISPLTLCTKPCQPQTNTTAPLLAVTPQSQTPRQGNGRCCGAPPGPAGCPGPRDPLSPAAYPGQLSAGEQRSPSSSAFSSFPPQAAAPTSAARRLAPAPLTAAAFVRAARRGDRHRTRPGGWTAAHGEGGRQRAGGEGPQRQHWSGPRLTRLPPGTAAASCTAGCAERPRGRDGPRLPTAAGGAGSATAPSTAGPTDGGGVTAPGQGTVGPCSAESARGAARWRGRAAPSLTPPRGRSRAVPQAAAVPCRAGSFGRTGGASVGVFKPILQAWNYNHRRTFSSPSSFQSMSKTFNRGIFFQIYR